MSRDSLALMSDVHGNLTALEAVLANIEDPRHHPVFNLGDYVGKGPRGGAVVARCQERLRDQPPRQLGRLAARPRSRVRRRGLRWWLADLAPGQGEGCAALPFCHDLLMSGRRMRLMHASAKTVHRRVRYVKTKAEFLGQFANTAATIAAVGDGPVPDVVGYADTHDPFYETQIESRTLFNTGSAGNAMGDPTASYVVLDGVLDEPDPAPFSIAFVRVPYDVEAELAVARDLGVPQYPGLRGRAAARPLPSGRSATFDSGDLTLDSYYH